MPCDQTLRQAVPPPPTTPPPSSSAPHAAAAATATTLSHARNVLLIEDTWETAGWWRNLPAGKTYIRADANNLNVYHMPRVGPLRRELERLDRLSLSDSVLKWRDAYGQTALEHAENEKIAVNSRWQAGGE